MGKGTDGRTLSGPAQFLLVINLSKLVKNLESHDLTSSTVSRYYHSNIKGGKQKKQTEKQSQRGLVK